MKKKIISFVFISIFCFVSFYNDIYKQNNTKTIKNKTKPKQTKTKTKIKRKKAN